MWVLCEGLKRLTVTLPNTTLQQLWTRPTSSFGWCTCVVMSWLRVKQSEGSSSPPGRCGHSLVMNHRGQLLLFGGSGSTKQYGDLFVLEKGRKLSIPPLPPKSCCQAFQLFQCGRKAVTLLWHSNFILPPHCFCCYYLNSCDVVMKDSSGRFLKWAALPPRRAVSTLVFV